MNHLRTRRQIAMRQLFDIGYVLMLIDTAMEACSQARKAIATVWMMYPAVHAQTVVARKRARPRDHRTRSIARQAVVDVEPMLMVHVPINGTVRGAQPFSDV